MTTRRQFVAGSAAMTAAFAQGQKNTISLAAWSMSGSFFQGGWKLLDLPAILNKKHGITALEHVNQFFESPMLSYIQKLNKACADNGVKQTILMVDGEGSTAAVDRAERKKSEIFHHKWIDIAAELGCHSVRCNFYGGAENWKEDKDLVKRGAETFQALVAYAKGTNLNIIVENHGRASSDPDILVALVKRSTTRSSDCWSISATGILARTAMQTSRRFCRTTGACRSKEPTAPTSIRPSTW